MQQLMTDTERYLVTPVQSSADGQYYWHITTNNAAAYQSPEENLYLRALLEAIKRESVNHQNYGRVFYKDNGIYVMPPKDHLVAISDGSTNISTWTPPFAMSLWEIIDKLFIPPHHETRAAAELGVKLALLGDLSSKSIAHNDSYAIQITADEDRRNSIERAIRLLERFLGADIETAQDEITVRDAIMVNGIPTMRERTVERDYIITREALVDAANRGAEEAYGKPNPVLAAFFAEIAMEALANLGHNTMQRSDL